MAIIRVEGKADFIRTVKRMSAQVLADLGPALREEASEVMDRSNALVPVGETGKLKASAFIDGPAINPKRKSTTVTAGYEHPEAGPIHEGVHWGVQQRAPKFLKKAVRAAKKSLPQRVAAAARSSISRNAKR